MTTINPTNIGLEEIFTADYPKQYFSYTQGSSSHEARPPIKCYLFMLDKEFSYRNNLWSLNLRPKEWRTARLTA